METDMKCPMCEAIKALNEALLKSKGVHQSYDPKSCSWCKGSGRVPKLSPIYRKRWKDLSGPEWTDRENELDWDRYITFEKVFE